MESGDETTEMPEVGESLPIWFEGHIEAECVGAIVEEVLVKLTPSVRSDTSWLQFGNLLAARHDPIGLVVGTIQITRKMTADENPDGWQTDDTWNGCIVAAVHNPFASDWRATCPVSDLAKSVWAKYWETESGN